jgi:hypothetical protein
MNAKETKAELDNCRNEGVLQFVAINDLVAGKVHWIKSKGNKVGVIRPTGASGGIVVVYQKCNNYTSTHYLEKWVDNIHKSIAPPLYNGSGYDEWLMWFNLASAVHSYRNDCVTKEDNCAIW